MFCRPAIATPVLSNRAYCNGAGINQRYVVRHHPHQAHVIGIGGWRRLVQVSLPYCSTKQLLVFSTKPSTGRLLHFQVEHVSLDSFPDHHFLALPTHAKQLTYKQPKHTRQAGRKRPATVLEKRSEPEVGGDDGKDRQPRS